jgi:hypothetical protein
LSIYAGEAFDIMQEGAFKFFGKGAEYYEEPMSLAAGSVIFQ